MKTEVVFKRAFNDALDLLAGVAPGQQIDSEYAFGRRLGVSRTTARKVLAGLTARGVVTTSQQGELIATGVTADSFPDSEIQSASDQVERLFMEFMLRDDASPGTMINELDLARRFGVATTAVRDFLNRFQRFGLIEKRPNSGWLFKGFTEAFAVELFEIRQMFELRSAQAFGALPDTSPLWREIARQREEHVALLGEIDTRFHDFSELDSRFHRLINSAAPNRFIDSFYDIITLIFHYHYQWNKRDERLRNEVAIGEHLAYIDALDSRDPARIDRAGRAHLASAHDTLVRSMKS